MTSIDAIREDFTLLDDWEDKYRYVIELGENLPPFPEDARDEEHRVHGCVSRVWLIADVGEGANPRIDLQGDSDAHIVRGLVAIMMALYSGRRASEIAQTDAEATLALARPRRAPDPAALQRTALDGRPHPAGSSVGAEAGRMSVRQLPILQYSA